MSARDRLVGWWPAERPFLLAIAVAALVRVLLAVAFPPGFVFSDGPTYLAISDQLVPHPDRPIGYSILLAALQPVSRSVFLITVVQHLLGLGVAVLAYVWLRRWGVSARVAALATLPLLFDELVLVLEHSVLSDVLFVGLLVLGLVLVTWRPVPGPALVVTAGLVLGTAVTVRLVGEPVIVVVAGYLLTVAASWRRRLALALATVVAFSVPVTAYVAWYHSSWGVWATSESSGRALYMRTTSFVDCSGLTLPDYERPLCPAEPLGERLDPTQYGWHNPAILALEIPPGSTRDGVLRDFARRAIRAQPEDYARVVARDFAMGFLMWTRADRYEYDTAYKWNFDQYVGYEPTSWTRPAYQSHGGRMPTSTQPLADWFRTYGAWVYLPGPLLLALLAVALAGFAVRRSDERDRRPVIILVLLVGLGLTLAPDVTAQFTWRYQVVAIVLVPLAAALGWTRVRRPGQPTLATPSTD